MAAIERARSEGVNTARSDPIADGHRSRAGRTDATLAEIGKRRMAVDPGAEIGVPLIAAPSVQLSGSTESVMLVGEATDFGNRVIRLLSEASFRIHRHPRLVDARRTGVLGHYDLILVEALPDGFTDLTTCSQAASVSDAAIIALADRPEESSRILALELGADDWMCSGASDRELLARVRALFRRRERLIRSSRTPSFYRVAGWTLHRERRELSHADGRTRQLTGSECDMLLALIKNAGRPLSCEELSALAGRGLARSVSVTVSRLRRKLGEDNAGLSIIRNVWGVGYMMESA